MENFIVSARKYRPDKFNTVVGQLHITNTLKNAIRTNQLAQAFLFCGPRGVGKTTCARVLAKTINCESPTSDSEACEQCASCISFRNGNSMNIHELDAASNNSVDDIRSLVDQVRYPPQSGRYKIYIIDEVHMLSTAAFNAFLKTLEEPPSYAIFILATTEKHKILPTILSRCQIFDFNRIKVDDIAKHLEYIAKQENISYELDGLHVIAQKADGAMRDACSMFDQITSFSQGNITYKAAIDNLNTLDYDYFFKITDALFSEDISKCLLIFDEILEKGFEGSNFIAGLSGHFRDLLVCKDPQTVKLLEVSDGVKDKYLEQSQTAPVGFIVSALSICNQAEINYKDSKNQRLQVELALLKICHIRSAINMSSLQSNEVKKKNSLTENTVKVEKKVEVVNNTKDDNKVHVSEAKITDNKIVIDNSKTQDIVVSSDKKIEDNVSISKTLNIKTVTPSLKSVKQFSGNSGLNSEILEEEQKLSNHLVVQEEKPFTDEDLLFHWQEYAKIAEKESKMAIYTILTSHKPCILQDYKIKITVLNILQENLIKEELVNLLRFLRHRLHNGKIDIVTFIDKDIMPEKKIIYTPSDKFAFLVEKNANLLEFKRRLDLNIEF